MTRAALVVLLALAGAGRLPSPSPAKLGRGPGGGAEPRPERVLVRVALPPWRSTGTFRLEAAGIADEGTVRDQGGFAGGRGAVRRVLEGRRGTLTLRLEVTVRPGTPSVVGRWTIAAGTGAYAALTGGGTFTATGAGTPGGNPYELQFLVGKLVVR